MGGSCVLRWEGENLKLDATLKVDLALFLQSVNCCHPFLELSLLRLLRLNALLLLLRLTLLDLLLPKTFDITVTLSEQHQLILGRTTYFSWRLIFMSCSLASFSA